MVEMRWVEEDVPAPELGDNINRVVKLLQYRHHVFDGYDKDGVPAFNGWSDWIDVPTVTAS